MFVSGKYHTVERIINLENSSGDQNQDRLTSLEVSHLLNRKKCLISINFLPCGLFPLLIAKIELLRKGIYFIVPRVPTRGS
jgi:hypothetical protein